jgi:hypothetical protein
MVPFCALLSLQWTARAGFCLSVSSGLVWAGNKVSHSIVHVPLILVLITQ